MSIQDLVRANAGVNFVVRASLLTMVGVVTVLCIRQPIPWNVLLHVRNRNDCPELELHPREKVRPLRLTHASNQCLYRCLCYVLSESTSFALCLDSFCLCQVRIVHHLPKMSFSTGSLALGFVATRTHLKYVSLNVRDIYNEDNNVIVPIPGNTF